MRMLLLALVLTLLGGCSAMMLGGTSKTYPPADCPEGQTRTEEGCEA